MSAAFYFFLLILERLINPFYVLSAFKTVLPDDLFTALEPADNTNTLDVTGTFTPWTTQSGYPVLLVTSNVDNKIKLNQKRFFIDKKDHDDQKRWSIPLTYTNTEAGFSITSTKQILPSAPKTDIEVTLPANGDLGCYILNVQQVGYYRVHYDEENWNAINTVLRSTNYTKIHVINRAQILDDALNLARVGYLKYDFVLNLIDYLTQEKHYIPWLSAFNGLSYLARRIGYGQDYEKFKVNFTHKIIKLK